MNYSTIEVENSSPIETTKNKVLSMRIEESLYNLLEDLTKELQTETVSNTARKVLYHYLLTSIYEKEWKNIHSENFEEFVQEVAEAGNKIEINKYKNLLKTFSEYLELSKSITDKVENSFRFVYEINEDLDKAVSKLEKAEIVWRKQNGNV
jgi:uncharacterized protein YaaW (UPF0174 family)